jgi:hypothetical protein
LGDVGESHRSVEDADGIDLVAEVFERLEDSTDLFGSSEVSAIDGGEHGLGEVGADADAPGGEAVDLKLGKVGDGRLLPDAADDEARVDEFDEAGEIIVLGSVLADDGVFDPGDESFVDEGGDGFGLKVAFKLDVKNGGFSERFNKLPETGRDSGIGGETLHGQNHHGGEIEALENLGLIHHGAISGSDGGDDEGIFGAFGNDDIEGLGVFTRGDVVEVRVPAIEKGGDAAGFDVADNPGIFGAVDFKIGIAGQGWDGDDGGVELLGCDWCGLHGS